MTETGQRINGWMHELQPVFVIGNLLILIGAALTLWGLVSKMETRITQNEILLKEVRSEVNQLLDVNRRLAALEAAELSRRDLLGDYRGTKSIIEFRLTAIERELGRLKSEKSAEDETR